MHEAQCCHARLWWEARLSSSEHGVCWAKIHGSRCARNAVKALFEAFESQQTLSQTQKALGNKRIRELAVGMFRRSPRQLVKGVQGEWYKDFPRPGLRRMPLTAPPSAAQIADVIGRGEPMERRW